MYGGCVTLPQAPRAPRSFWRVAATPRMVGLLLAFLAAAAVCGALGAWQLDRAHERARLAAAQEQAEVEAGGPQPLDAVLRPQEAFPGTAVGRAVTVRGTYDIAGQLYVPGRIIDGHDGYLVLTGLRVSDDGSGGASWAELSGPPVLPVVRGWSPTIEQARAAVPPSGTVSLTAYLQAAEAAGDVPTADGTIQMISSAQLLGAWGGPIYSGYAVVATSDPAQAGDLTPLPRPTIEGGDGLNLQNLFYALEWWIFAGFAVALWLRMVRDEAHGGKDPLEVAGVAGAEEAGTDAADVGAAVGDDVGDDAPHAVV